MPTGIWPGEARAESRSPSRAGRVSLAESRWPSLAGRVSLAESRDVEAAVAFSVAVTRGDAGSRRVKRRPAQAKRPANDRKSRLEASPGIGPSPARRESEWPPPTDTARVCRTGRLGHVLGQPAGHGAGAAESGGGGVGERQPARAAR